MVKWECAVCGHIHDPEKGDHLSAVEPGTAFEDLPAEWRCPICRSGKDAFQKAEE